MPTKASLIGLSARAVPHRPDQRRDRQRPWL